jgi:DNA-directed RNA polymerase subunit M/transcription elongation factor TFIIS
MNFCPKCENYLYLEQASEEVTNAAGITEKRYFLNRRCRTCGYNEVDVKGGLVNETIVQERASEGYKILLNELKQYNPELLHKERLLAITKSDMLDEELIKAMKKELPKIPYVFISSVAQQGIVELKDLIWKHLNADEQA